MNAMHSATRGFTLIEMMIVVALIGIVASMALPTFQDRVIRSEVSEGVGLVEFVRQGISEYYAKYHRLPKDNSEAGLPPANRIVGSYVSSVAVHDGIIDITFGNLSNRNLAGRKLSLRPATVAGYPQVPIAWVCGHAAVPDHMIAPGANATDVPAPNLPLDCRAR